MRVYKNKLAFRPVFLDRCGFLSVVTKVLLIPPARFCWLNIKETCLFDETVQFARNCGGVDTCHLLQWILKWELQRHHCCRCTHLPTGLTNTIESCFVSHSIKNVLLKLLKLLTTLAISWNTLEMCCCLLKRLKLLMLLKPLKWNWCCHQWGAPARISKLIQIILKSIRPCWKMLLKLLKLLMTLAISWNTLEMCCCLLKRLKLLTPLRHSQQSRDTDNKILQADEQVFTVDGTPTESVGSFRHLGRQETCTGSDWGGPAR